MRIYLATWFEDYNGRDLSAMKSDKRLVSYFGCLKNKITKTRLAAYVRKGVFTKSD